MAIYNRIGGFCSYSYSDVPEEFEVSMSWPSAIKELLLFKKAEGYTEELWKDIRVLWSCSVSIAWQKVT